MGGARAVQEVPEGFEGDGLTTMSFGNVVNKFHNQYSFADTSTSEETNFTSLGIGSKQIYNLGSSDQNLLLDRHLFEFGSFCVDGSPLVGFNWTTFINWVTNDIDDTAKSFFTDRDTDG